MAARIMIQVGQASLELEDLGTAMNAEFVSLYRQAFGAIDWARHGQAALLYFDQHSGFADHDAYFNNLTILWDGLMGEEKFTEAEHFWHERIGVSLQWEIAHRPARIHKGTPFYFLGVTHILSGNLERGFLAMHRALDKDVRTHSTPTPDTPAYAFVTLDSAEANQFFRPWVLGLAQYVEQEIQDFNKASNTPLTLTQVRNLFLANPVLREEAFYFVSSVAHAREYETGPLRVEAESEFGEMLESRLLFDLCLVCDRFIGKKVPTAVRKFIDRVQEIAVRMQPGHNLKEDLIALNRKAQASGGLDPVVRQVLQGRGVCIHGRALSDREVDLALAYLFRNHGAHVLAATPVVHERFAGLVQRILNALFQSVRTFP